MKKRKILNQPEEKRHITYRGTKIRINADLPQICKPDGICKVLKGKKAVNLKFCIGQIKAKPKRDEIMFSKTCTRRSTEVLFVIAESWKQLICPLIGKWRNKLWDMNYRYIQQHEWNLIMLSEKSQIQINAYGMIPLHKIPPNVNKSVLTESKLFLAYGSWE